MNLVLMLCCALLVQGDDKVTLKWQPKDGEKVATTQTMKVNLKVSAAGQTMDMSMTSLTKASTEFGDVKDGVAGRRVVVFEQDTEEMTQGGETNSREKATHGKTFKVVMKDGKPVIEGADELDDDEKGKLARGDVAFLLLPKNPVSKGESWELSADELRAFFEEKNMKGKFAMTLSETREEGGRKVAAIAIVFDVSDDKATGQRMNMKGSGTMLVTLDRGLPVSLTATGPVLFTEGEGEEKVEGNGTLDVKITLDLK